MFVKVIKGGATHKAAGGLDMGRSRKLAESLQAQTIETILKMFKTH